VIVINIKKIALGSDHGGYHLKEHIKAHLLDLGYEVEDFGTHSTDSCDYPDIAQVVSVHIAKKKADCGILVCGTGVGISISANKVKGIRAACCSDTFSARYSRLHNDANILCLGERVVGFGLALELVDAFLYGEFEGGRHQKRINKISEIENS
jgi:ribose 5-phosphate isomerase B